MKKEDAIKNLMESARIGALLTIKHDPSHLDITYDSYRSVLSYDLATYLDDFIESGEYKVTEYINNNEPYSPIYLEIAPYPTSTFTVPASGVPAFHTKPRYKLDRLVAVSGTKQGWHIFGEDSEEITHRINEGVLEFVEEST